MVGGSIARPWERETYLRTVSVSQNRTVYWVLSGLLSVTAAAAKPQHRAEGRKNILSAPSSLLFLTSPPLPDSLGWMWHICSVLCDIISCILQSWWISSRETMMSSSSKLFHSLLKLQTCFNLTTCSATNYKAPGNARWTVRSQESLPPV